MQLAVASFRNLPVEVVVGAILSYVHPIELCRLRRVCKQWQRMVAAHFSAIKNLNLCDGVSQYYLTSEGLISIFQSLRHLRMLTLDCCSYRVATEDTLISMTTHCPRLEELSVQECGGVTDHVLEAIAKHCPRVRHLNLKRCFQVSESGLISLAKHCKQLQEISIYRCYGVTDRAIKALLHGCRQLRVLDLGYCYKVTDSSLRCLHEQAPRLELLGVHGCPEVSDTVVRSLCEAGVVVNNISALGLNTEM